MLEKIRDILNRAEDIDIDLIDLAASPLRTTAREHAEALCETLEQLLAEAERAALEKIK